MCMFCVKHTLITGFKCYRVSVSLNYFRLTRSSVRQSSSYYGTLSFDSTRKNSIDVKIQQENIKKLRMVQMAEHST